MQGFKSFVDKTSLKFDMGITAVVGPNGSGKSNIADAVRWVLGEQSAKNLRGGKMEDVIFSGTENRKSVGFAEVSINLDNQDNKLNVDYGEVKITRRLYRSGESEYLINGTSCRLKDIIMMFADTGIGKDGYSIISQGRVDEILSNKSEERRNIFEEASGIMKYRMKKQESERKIEASDQNILRINDIINELASHIEPLNEQAEVARQYLALKYELRDIEVGVLIDGIRRSNERLDEAKSKLDSVLDEIHEKEVSLDKEKYDNVRKSDFSHKLDEQLTIAREKGFEIEKTIERLSSDIRLNEEKIQAIRDNYNRVDNEQHMLSGKISDLNIKAQEKSGESDTIKATLLQHEEQVAIMEERFHQVMELLSKNARETDDLKENIMNKKLEMGERSNAISALEPQIAMLEARQKELERDLQIIEQTKLELNAQKDLLTNQKDTKDKEFRVLSKQILEQQNMITAEKSRIEQIGAQLNNTNAELHSKQSRLNLMKEMEQNLEGYARSVKEILTLCHENKTFGQGIYGAVAQLINVDEKYELAVETALGQAYQNVVTQSEEQAKQAIDYLKEKRLGRATFLPMTAVSGRRLDNDILKQLKDLKGFCGVAADLVKYEQNFTNIILNLLGRVVIFDTVENAIVASKRFKYAFTCVTLDGDILRTSGAITGGSSDQGRKTGTLGRTREIPKLEEDVKSFQQLAVQLKQDFASLKESIAVIEKTQSENMNFARKLEVKLAEINATLNNNEERILHENTRCEQLSKDKDGINIDISGLKAAATQFKEDLLVIENGLIELQSSLNEFDEKTQSGARVRDAMTRDLTEKKLKAGDTRNSFDMCIADMERFSNEAKDLDEQLKYMFLQKTEGQQQINLLKADIEGLSLTIKRNIEVKTGKAIELERLLEEKLTIDEDLSGMMDRISDYTDTIQKLREEAGRLEVRKVKAETEDEGFKNRLWDEYELTYSKGLELTGGKPVENYAACQKRISELKNAIKELGAVNVAAIEELEKTRERFNFMTTQRDDMEDARAKLQRIINDVTSVMKKQFLEQFQLIRQSFSIVFRELFNGGRADIVLSDESNVLESGVEIHVQPPGKKLQNMMLLSGGERALTAIALLFAILRLRPSPFCVLDEIEAALDDANVLRFANYIKNFSENTQFVMVTHRKGTMESSDSIYGVTMEEKGISRVVSMKMAK